MNFIQSYNVFIVQAHQEKQKQLQPYKIISTTF